MRSLVPTWWGQRSEPLPKDPEQIALPKPGVGQKRGHQVAPGQRRGWGHQQGAECLGVWYPSHHGSLGKRPKLGWGRQAVAMHLDPKMPDCPLKVRQEWGPGQLIQSSEGVAGKGRQTEHQGRWQWEPHWECLPPWLR